MSYQECWNLSEKQFEGHSLRVRLNDGIDSYVCHPRYMHQVCITVPLNDADEYGFPFPEECKLLDELELLLKEGLEEQQCSVFAAVITSDGIRLYVIYTYLPEYCQKVIKGINQDWYYHQISSTTEEDKHWETIESLL